MSDREFGGQCACFLCFESESRLLFLRSIILLVRTLLETCFVGCLGKFLEGARHFSIINMLV
jgi:hypothetical protein